MAVHVDDNPLLCAAKYHFGNWQNALAAAGIETEQPRPGVQRRRIDGRACSLAGHQPRHIMRA